MHLPMLRCGVLRAAGALGVLTALASAARAQSGTAAPPDTGVRVAFGAFVDGYYAWDVGRPPTRDRSFAGGALFTTQPSRHNEFNVNLAFVEAVLSGPRVRGRLALQTGTSVQSNYSFEPSEGTVSGPSLAQLLDDQDGVVFGTGVREENALPVPNAPFRAVGGSLGIDVQPQTRVLWRTEARGWRNRDPIFPDGRERMPTRNSGFIVTSLALTF